MEQQEQSNLIKEISAPLYMSRGWMKFLGILSIVYGAMLVFTIVGILIAWLPIWLGILIFQTASSAEKAFIAGDKAEMVKSMNQIKTYFTISGLLALVAIILSFVFLGMGLLTYIFSAMHIY